MTVPTSSPVLNRRGLLLAGGAALLTGACAKAAEAPSLTVYKTPHCTCCGGWITHMTRAGFRPAVVQMEDLNPVFQKHGIPFELSSCHVGLVGGYVTVGHVPSKDVLRLLREKPRAIGLTVPGMPIGSPGMESPTGESEAFDTLLLLDASGRTRVFARHARQARDQ